MLNNIKELGEWLRKLVETKAGIFVLGLFIGAAPALAIAYIYYQAYIRREQIAQEERSKANIWQERAYNANDSCVDRTKRIYESINEMIDKVNQRESTNLIEDKRQLSEYKNLTNKVDKLNKELK